MEARHVVGFRGDRNAPNGASLTHSPGAALFRLLEEVQDVWPLTASARGGKAVTVERCGDVSSRQQAAQRGAAATINKFSSLEGGGSLGLTGFLISHIGGNLDAPVLNFIPLKNKIKLLGRKLLGRS